MRNYMKKWMTYLFVTFLVFGAFPLLSTSTGAEAGDRAAEVVIHEVSIVNATYIAANETSDHTIKTGTWNVSVDFNITGEMDAWAEFGISRADSWTNNTVNYTLGIISETPGGMKINNASFAFVAGVYWINVTIGNINDGPMNTTSSNQFTFGDVKKVEVTAVTLDGVVVNDHYAKAVHDISVVLNNTGNIDLDDWAENTTMLINVSNCTNWDFYQEYINVTAPFYAGDGIVIQLPWTPQFEAFYIVNVSYNNSDCDDQGLQEFSANFTIMDEVTFDYTYDGHTAIVALMDNIVFDFNITNAGHIDADCNFAVNITDDNSDWTIEIADIMNGMTIGQTLPKHFETIMENVGSYHIKAIIEGAAQASYAFDVVRVEGDVSGYVDDTVGNAVADAAVVIENGTGAWFNDTTNATGYYKLTLPLGTYDIYINATGYIVSANVTFTLTESVWQKELNFTLAMPVVFNAPTLVDQTNTTGSREGDEVVFNVLYTDADGDEGEVYVLLSVWNDTDTNVTNHTWLDGIPIPMVNETNNWTGGVNFTYTADALENMTYRYSFKAIDPVLVPITTTPVEFTIKEALQITGTISGKVTSGTGNDTLNISGAKVIIYYMEEVKFMNGTNVTGYDNVTRWFNATTDANGEFTKVLDFNTYKIYVEADDYDAAPEVSFTLDLARLTVTMDFSLVKAIVPPTKFVLSGSVTPANAIVKIDGMVLTVTNGTYSIELEAGGHTITAIYTGYDDYSREVNLTTARTHNIVMTETSPTTHTVTWGPWKDFAGYTLTFVLGNNTYIGYVDADGNVAIVLPIGVDVPAGHEMKLTKDDETITFINGGTPEKESDTDGDSSLLWLWILIIVVVTIIIVIVIIILKRKSPTVPPRIEEEEFEGEIDDDFKEEKEDLEEDEDIKKFDDESSDQEDKDEDWKEENKDDEPPEPEDDDWGGEEEDEFDDDDWTEDEDEFDDDDWTEDEDEFDEEEPGTPTPPPPAIEFEDSPPPPEPSFTDPSYKEKLASLSGNEAPSNVRKIIPGYIVTHKIGAGGFATVYRALDDRGEPVAIKLPKFLDETLDSSVLENFKAEANMWKKLKHRNIVKFYNSDIRPVPYMVIEIMEGGNLNQLMKKHTFNVQEVIDIMQQVLSGMAFAHRMASVHRDIKPENILFTKDGVPKITDWGIGKFMASEGLSKTIGAKGTLAYGSPEQISKKKFGNIDWQTDVFQLGIVFYEMLTGVNPFYDDDALGIMGKLTGETPEPPSSINPDVPKFLDNVILKALQKEKKDRWASADIMNDRLKIGTNKKKENLIKYRRTLTRAMADGVISNDEKEMLFELREHFDISMIEHQSLLTEIRNRR